MHLGLRGDAYDRMRFCDLVREVREHRRAERFHRQALAFEVARTLFGTKEQEENEDQLPEEATLAIAQQMIANARGPNGAA